MKKIIHHVRKQPEEVRRHILHIAIMACAAILAMLWVYSLGRTLASPDNQTQAAEDVKPFAALKDNIIDGYNSIIEPNLGVEEMQ